MERDKLAVTAKTYVFADSVLCLGGLKYLNRSDGEPK